MKNGKVMAYGASLAILNIWVYNMTINDFLYYILHSLTIHSIDIK
jgi:hypothetical protein